MGKSDEVRRMLDERGVEHEDCDISVGEKAYGTTTYWECGDVVARYSEKTDVGTLLEVWDVSPEQAIAATVGNVGSANVEEVLRQLVAQLGDAAGFHFANKYVDCIVEEYAGKFATAGMTEEEADSHDLMEAIRDDDGVRYSMDEVLDIMRKDVAETVVGE